MQRGFVLVIAVAVASCATQGPVQDWRLSQNQALAIGNNALAANNLEPARYKWHQYVCRFTDTRDWYIVFSPRYPGPGGNDVVVTINDVSQRTTVRVLDQRWTAGAGTAVPDFGGYKYPPPPGGF